MINNVYIYKYIFTKLQICQESLCLIIVTKVILSPLKRQKEKDFH